MRIIALLITFSCIARTHQLHQQHPHKTKKYFQELLKQEPDNTHALNQLGKLYFSEHDYARAFHYFGQCITRENNNPDFVEQYAHTLYCMGQFSKARDLFEMLHDYDRKRALPWKKLPDLYIRDKDWYYVGKYMQPDTLWWYNADIRTKSILLDLSDSHNTCGDIIQIMRYAMHLHKAGAQVAVYVRPDMVPLVQRCPYLAQVIATDAPKPTADITYQMNAYRCIVCMREQMYDPSPDIPYIQADKKLVEIWREHIVQDTQFKVGICWVSDNTQSPPITLEQYAPILDTPHISFYSLQNNRYNQIYEWNINKPSTIISYPDFDTKPLMDSAALIAQLDLVITVDSAIAHLAGAMGKPVWLVLPYVADCRWFGQTDTTSPLYPTMKIFRQPRAGDWQAPIGAIQKNLLLHTKPLKKQASMS